MTARRTDPIAVLEAFEAQHALLLGWSTALHVDDLGRPSTLPGWSIGDVFIHLGIGVSMLPEAIGRPAGPGQKPLTLGRYVVAYAAAAGEIEETVHRQRADADPRDGFAAQTASAIARAREVSGDPVLMARRGPLRFGDVVLTRLLEFVVHARDLARSVPRNPPPMDPDAVRLVTRALAGALAERHPGRSVEVRVPPYAAVQCVEGAVHGRGTPPNVVETDPGTFIDLATSRVTFEAAVAAGSVRASGTRSDLSDYLPLLR